MKFSSIYGVIKLGYLDDYLKTTTYIKSIGEDGIYPFITTKMFGLGDNVSPYYYHNNLITFGTTYKYFGESLIDWNFFILKIENLLRNIDFECATFHIDSFCGDYKFNWYNKKNVLPHYNTKYKNEEYKLFETKDFYFGFGDRSLGTPYPDERYSKESDELIFEGFCYPIKFSENAFQKVREFNSRIKDLELGSKISYKEIMNENMDDRTYEIIYDLKLKGIYQFNEYKGDIIKLKNVEL